MFNTTHEPVKTFHIQTITVTKVSGGKVLFTDDSSKEVEKKIEQLHFSVSKELMRVIGEYWCVLQERRPEMCYAMKEHDAHAGDRTQMLRKLPRRHEDVGLIPVQ